MSFVERARESLAQRFEVSRLQSSLGRECWAGFTNFLVMSYSIALIPSLLGDGPVSKLSIGVATCVGAAVLCLLMGLVANRPFALAPGLGIATIISIQLLSKDPDTQQSLMTWPQAMGAVVIEGAIAVTLVAFGLHRQLAGAIPKSLKCAIAIGIGAFLMKLGLSKSGVLQDGEIRFDGPDVLVTLFGFLVTLALFFSRWRHAALPIGITVTTLLAHACGFASVPTVESEVASTVNWLDLPGLSGVIQCFGENGVGGMTLTVAVLSLLLTDTFDSLGTSHTLTRMMGGLRGEEVPRLRRVLLVDSIGAVAGGAMGTGSITTYVESAAGIGTGGRTGLAAIVTGVLFLLALFATPVVGFVPDQATAPALIFIGFIMAQSIKEIDFFEQAEGIPALLMIIIMPITGSITCGIGIGFIVYTFIGLLKWLLKDPLKLHPLMVASAVLFMVHFSAELTQ